MTPKNAPLALIALSVFWATPMDGTQWLLYIDADGNAFAAQSGTGTGTVVRRHQP